MKISYSALPNIKSALQRHNHKVLRTEDVNKRVALCNCTKRTCPVNGKCLTKGVVYKATVTTSSDEKEYIGSSCDLFKSRYNNHLSSFKLPAKRKATAIASYVHELKDAGTDYNIRWEIIYKHGVSRRPEGRLCAICNLERFAIAMADKKKSLNKRSELTSKCQHQRACYL